MTLATIYVKPLWGPVRDALRAHYGRNTQTLPHLASPLIDQPHESDILPDSATHAMAQAAIPAGNDKTPAEHEAHLMLAPLTVLAGSIRITYHLNRENNDA